MTSLTKLAAKLPDDNDANGLDHFVGHVLLAISLSGADR